MIRLYGAELFGTYVVAQASILIVWRLASLGLDKAALWWVPRAVAGNSSEGGLRAMFFWVTSTSIVLCGVIALGAAPLLAEWSAEPRSADALRWMALGLVPMALMELAIHSVMGTRNMAARVLIRDGLVPTLQLASALFFGVLGWKASGLPFSFLLSTTVGAIAALWVGFRLLERRLWQGSMFRLSPEVVRYAGSIWVSELSAAILTRMDLYALARYSDPRSVGIYAAVTQLAGSLRQVRQSFDPMVVALCAELSIRRDSARLVAGFSRAAAAVLSIQLPIWAFFFCFDSWILPIYGAGFEAGAAALVILSACWVLNGVLGLNGMVLLGQGRSELMLAGILLTMALQVALLPWLISTHGLEGAALTVALSYTALGFAHWYLATRTSGVNPYDARVLRTVIAACVAVGALLAAYYTLQPFGELARRVGAFAVFALVAGGTYFGWLNPRERGAPSGA